MWHAYFNRLAISVSSLSGFYWPVIRDSALCSQLEEWKVLFENGWIKDHILSIYLSIYLFSERVKSIFNGDVEAIIQCL